MDSSTLLPLIGIPVVVIGFALRFNPLLVVVVAGLATGLLVGMDFGMLLETFGEKFVNSRSLATFILILPVIGLLEYYGLKERAQAWVAKIASATSARILMLYFVAREGTAALGLMSLGGHAQTVRPLLAPMAEGGRRPGRNRATCRRLSATKSKPMPPRVTISRFSLGKISLSPLARYC